MLRLHKNVLKPINKVVVYCEEFTLWTKDETCPCNDFRFKVPGNLKRVFVPITFVFFSFQGCHQLGAGRIWRIICARQEMFVLQTCSVMERAWLNFSVEMTWSMRCAGWIGPSSAHIRWVPVLMRFNCPLPVYMVKGTNVIYDFFLF